MYSVNHISQSSADKQEDTSTTVVVVTHPTDGASCSGTTNEPHHNGWQTELKP